MKAEAHEVAESGGLVRGIGLGQATALNITMIVGAGVFVTIPPMLGVLPGPYAVLAWLLAGALILVDGMIWSELGAALPASGGSYHFLLESYGRERWGRLMAFLFIWQFLLSGPLELASGLVAMALFASGLSPQFHAFNEEHTVRLVLWESQNLAVSVGPARLLAFFLGLVIILLQVRHITTLGRLTLLLWCGVLGLLGWVLVAGAVNFRPERAFDFSGAAAGWPDDLGLNLGKGMILAIYSYLGYYTVCYVGDEVRDPGRVIPRSILLSALTVVVLFTCVHLAFLGTVPWQEVPTASDTYSLPADFMERLHGPWAASAVTVLLMGSCFAAAFAGMLGYSRIPYGAARAGHFFAFFRAVHPVHHIPHRSLFLVGGLTLFWSFFDLASVISALITTRLLEQFIGQVIGVVLLRRNRPDLYRPFRMWLYPLPCLLALAGWLYLYLASGLLYIALGAGTLLAGVGAFLLWSRHTGGWPFDRPSAA